MRKRTYDPALVQSLLSDRKRNGWTLGELSRRSGIPIGTLGTWAAKEQRLHHKVAGSHEGFTEVVLAAEPTGQGDSAVRFRHDSGWTIELRGDEASAVAAKIAEAIARCS
jgi:hypothetical protein